jgi:hypothetical protein
MMRTTVMLLTLVPAVLHAQLSGLIKKATTPPSLPGSSAPAVTAPGADDGSLPYPNYSLTLRGVPKTLITPDVIARFLTGLHAERADRDSLERANANNGVGKTYMARDLVARCDSLKKADSLDAEASIKRMQAAAGDPVQSQKVAQAEIANMKARAADPLHAQCQNNKAGSMSDHSFWAAMRSAQSQQDSVGAAAGKFTTPDYALLRERIASYVLNPNRTKNYPGFLPSEISAMDAQFDVLHSLLARDYAMGGVPKQPSQL